MKTGILTIDILTLQETNVLQDSTDGPDERSIRIGGIETTCDTATVEVLRDNLLGLVDRVVPVTFERKSSYNGYYRVTDVSADTDKWFNGSTAMGWQITMLRVGPDNTVDVESRLANIVRANDFSLTGERWHAPAQSHLTYFTGSTVGTPLTRTSDTGAITIYRGIPAGVNPRWGATVTGFITGRVKFLSNGVELVAPRQLLGISGWELNNGLIRVRPAVSAGTTLAIAFYDGTAWRERNWDVRIAGSSVRPDTHITAVNLVRRNHEVAAVRIHASQPSNGQRVIIDLLLRRGSRILEGYVQRTTSGDITVAQDTAEPISAGTGYVYTSGEDVHGLRSVVGSARSFTSTDGGITKSTTTTLDFFIGAEIPKASAGGSNPGFETGAVAPWSGTNGTVTVRSDTPKFGTYYGRVTATTGAVDLRIDHAESTTVGTAGRSYTIAGWLRSPVTVAAGQAFVTLHWFNGASYMSSSGFAAPALSAGVWTPVVGSAVAPANTTNIGRQASLLAGVVSVGTILDVDSLQVRETIDSGDSASALRDQYIGAMAETTEVVRR